MLHCDVVVLETRLRKLNRMAKKPRRTKTEKLADAKRAEILRLFDEIRDKIEELEAILYEGHTPGTLTPVEV